MAEFLKEEVIPEPHLEITFAELDIVHASNPESSMRGSGLTIRAESGPGSPCGWNR